jgi:hypothetical protein
MASWKITSKLGFDFEKFILEDINEKILPLAYKNMIKEKYSLHDIILFNGDFSKPPKTLECKYDLMAGITGNICIEVGCNGRWSGLLISKADYWLIADGEKAYIAERQKIHECIVENMENIEYMKNCRVLQENSITKDMDIYLIKKSIFEKYCVEISNINELKYSCFISA